MKHSFLFFYFVGIFIQLKMSWTNVNTKEQVYCQYGTDTSTMVDNYGLLEMTG